MILNSEDTDVGVINKGKCRRIEELISTLRVRMVWKRKVLALSLYIFLINMSKSRSELLFILQGVSVRDAK